MMRSELVAVALRRAVADEPVMDEIDWQHLEISHPLGEGASGVGAA